MGISLGVGVGITGGFLPGVGIVLPLSIAGTPGATAIGAPYSFNPSASGGTAPYTLSMSLAPGFTEAVLPAGLSFSPSNGVTGTPVVG